MILYGMEFSTIRSDQHLLRRCAPGRLFFKKVLLPLLGKTRDARCSLWFLWLRFLVHRDQQSRTPWRRFLVLIRPAFRVYSATREEPCRRPFCFLPLGQGSVFLLLVAAENLSVSCFWLL